MCLCVWYGVHSLRTNSNLVDTCMVHVLPTCDVFMISKSCDNCEMIFMNIFSVQNLNASMNFGIFYSLSIYMNLFMKTVIFIREVNLSPFFVVHLVFFMIIFMIFILCKKYIKKIHLSCLLLTVSKAKCYNSWLLYMCISLKKHDSNFKV